METIRIDITRILHFRNHGGQAAAIIESRVSDGSHGIGDGYGGQAAAAFVFTTYCLPNCCDLNGRKVMTWILWMERMMKI